MSNIDLYEVVRKLTGNIEPVGETYADNASFENLKALTELVDRLVTDIDSVAENEGRSEFSMQRAGKHASHFLTSNLGIVE